MTYAAIIFLIFLLVVLIWIRQSLINKPITNLDDIIHNNHMFTKKLRLKNDSVIQIKYLISGTKVMPLYAGKNIVIFDGLIYTKYSTLGISDTFFRDVKKYIEAGYETHIITNQEREYIYKFAFDKIKIHILTTKNLDKTLLKIKKLMK